VSDSARKHTTGADRWLVEVEGAPWGSPWGAPWSEKYLVQRLAFRRDPAANPPDKSRRRGPVPGTTDFVRREREDIARRVLRGRRKGERPSVTLDRFLAGQKNFGLPGSGDDQTKRDQLLRVVSRLARQNSK
jgi:hypothetical protein